jgi:hypothetical protein
VEPGQVRAAAGAPPAPQAIIHWLAWGFSSATVEELRATGGSAAGGGAARWQGRRRSHGWPAGGVEGGGVSGGTTEQEERLEGAEAR